MEMMEEDEPLSSSEAPRAPALDTEEGLSIPVAGPETPFRPTSGMPGLTPTGEHVTALQFDGEQVLRGLVCVCDELQACCKCFDCASAGADVDPDFCALTDGDNLRRNERDQSGNGAANGAGETCYLGAPCCEKHFRC